MLRCLRRVWTSWTGSDHQPCGEGTSVTTLRASLVVPHPRQTRLGGRHRPPNRSQSPKPSAQPGRVTSTSRAPHSTHGTSRSHSSGLRALIASPPPLVLLQRSLHPISRFRNSLVQVNCRLTAESSSPVWSLVLTVPGPPCCRARALGANPREKP